MNTISKIGQAALTRLLQGKFRASGIKFPKEEFDLTKVRGSGENGWTDYKVWGIELGLKRLAARVVSSKRDRTFNDLIVELTFTGHFSAMTLPSHFIVHSWREGDKQEHTYTVYRLSQEQEQKLAELHLIVRDTAPGESIRAV